MLDSSRRKRIALEDYAISEVEVEETDESGVLDVEIHLFENRLLC